MTRSIALPLGAAPDFTVLLAVGVPVTAMAVALITWVLRHRQTRQQNRLGSPAVKVAALAALGCTAYSADASWRFAADYLDMAGTAERAGMFAAAELALFATALMARQNLATLGAPGLPGSLVWAITAVQVIPAYAESGPVGGTVRAFVGPVMAAMLWHIAMGIELRLRTPGAASHGLIATVGREARERLMSRLGIAALDRNAAQITRDRATDRAVSLAARLAEHTPEQQESRRGRRLTRQLSKAIGRSSAGTDPVQRAKLLGQLAARRHALTLATVPLPSPWSPHHAVTRTVSVPAPTAGNITVPIDGAATASEPIGDRRTGAGDRGVGTGLGRGPASQAGPENEGRRAMTGQDQPRTTDQVTETVPADRDGPAPDHRTNPAPDQATGHDTAAPDQQTGSGPQGLEDGSRTRTTAGQAARDCLGPAEQDRADQDPGPAWADQGVPGDHMPDQQHPQTTDRSPEPGTADRDAADHTDQPADRPADHDEDGASGGSQGAQSADHGTSPALRTTSTDHNDDVPWEVKVEVARQAALESGRMTRRVIRPHLRRHNITISNEGFRKLQAQLYADPQLAHLPRRTRRP